MSGSYAGVLLIHQGKMGVLCHLQVKMLEGLVGNLQRQGSYRKIKIVLLHIQVIYSISWTLQPDLTNLPVASLAFEDVDDGCAILRERGRLWRTTHSILWLCNPSSWFPSPLPENAKPLGECCLTQFSEWCGQPASSCGCSPTCVEPRGCAGWLGWADAPGDVVLSCWSSTLPSQHPWVRVGCGPLPWNSTVRSVPRSLEKQRRSFCSLLCSSLSPTSWLLRVKDLSDPSGGLGGADFFPDLPVCRWQSWLSSASHLPWAGHHFLLCFCAANEHAAVRGYCTFWFFF